VFRRKWVDESMRECVDVLMCRSVSIVESVNIVDRVEEVADAFDEAGYGFGDVPA